MQKHFVKTAIAAVVLAFGAASASAADWFPFKVEQMEPAFSPDAKATMVDYVPLPKASKKWDICVSFPHMKDAYWLGVDYGAAEEAKRLGVKMQLVEAGGYTNLPKQISQIEDCVARGAQAVVIGAISADGLNGLIKTLAAKKIPVVDLVNGINSPDISAKSLVSFQTMGAMAGEFIAKKHPKGGKAVKVGWFPGPAGAGWVEAAHKGFMDATKDSALVILEPKYGDTGKEAQSKLIEDVLQAHPDVEYIVGPAINSEAAVPILRERNLDKKIKVVAFHTNPGAVDGIAKGRVLGAPSDSMVIQGRIAIDQAVRILEGKEYMKHVGPKIFVVDQDNIKKLPREILLAPADYKPVFKVN
jgi:protein TorT